MSLGSKQPPFSPTKMCTSGRSNFFSAIRASARRG
jgi:hypothetical protein